MLNLKNSFIMPPLKLGYCDKPGFINNKHLMFYKNVGKSPGAITPEPLYLDSGLREIPTQLGIDNDDKIEGLLQLTETIHQNGAKAIAHLNHPGRMANPMIPGNYFLSATENACEAGGKTPKMMDADDMKNVITLFVQTAKRAEKSGFDFIEIQSGHGYLLSQFISPAVNNRTDAYGGSFNNRIKFPLEVIQATIQAVKIPIIVRISASEMTPNGIQLEEMIQYAKILEEYSVKAVHVSVGTVCNTPPWYFQHMFVPKGKSWEFAFKIKEKINIPVIFVGQINTHEDIDKIKNDYKGDYLATGRALVADPDFIEKYLDKNKGNYRPCLACSEGCLGGVKSGKGLGCVVNPEINNTQLISDKKATNPKKIAIIGAGLAGMESALRLDKKGHRVSLFEKEKLGGQFNLAYLPPKKASLKKLINYYSLEIENSNINTHYQEISAKEIIKMNYNHVLIASGSQASFPPIKGLNNFHWAEILQSEDKPKNERIVVVGGGLIGIEIASMLVEHNNEVIVVEMQDEIARGMEMIERKMTLKKLAEKAVQIYTGYQVTEMDEQNKTMIINNGESKILTGINQVVLATGMKSINTLGKELDGIIPYQVIGDAKAPANAQEAIASAYQAAVVTI